MSGCCEEKSFDGASSAYRRALYAVIAINAIMFIVEMTAGLMSGSQALKADALDFGGDTATYALSLMVIGASVRTRALASLVKGASLAIIAFAVLAMTIYRVLNGASPEPGTMGLIGFIALLANPTSVFILLRWRDGPRKAPSCRGIPWALGRAAIPAPFQSSYWRPVSALHHVRHCGHKRTTAASHRLRLCHSGL